MMLNQVPVRLGLKIVTPFELVHNANPYSKTWFELFSIVYFNGRIENTERRSKLHLYTLDVIVGGRDEK